MEQGLKQKQLQILQDYAGPGAASTKRWMQVWRQRLTVTLLVLSDVLVALLVLEAASSLQGIWVRGTLITMTIATTVPAVAM